VIDIGFVCLKQTKALTMVKTFICSIAKNNSGRFRAS
jgi:hypothetical protein